MMINNIFKKSISKIRLNIIFIALCFSFFLPVFSHAGTSLPEGLVIKDKYIPGEGSSIGKVYSVQAEVIIMHSDKKYGYRARKDLPLYEGDTIVTRDKGRIEAVLNDGSTIILVPQTDVELTGSVYDQAKGIRPSFINMTLGKARFLVTKLADFFVALHLSSLRRTKMHASFLKIRDALNLNFLLCRPNSDFLRVH